MHWHNLIVTVNVNCICFITKRLISIKRKDCARFISLSLSEFRYKVNVHSFDMCKMGYKSFQKLWTFVDTQDSDNTSDNCFFLFKIIMKKQIDMIGEWSSIVIKWPMAGNNGQYYSHFLNDTSYVNNNRFTLNLKDPFNFAKAMRFS